MSKEATEYLRHIKDEFAYILQVSGCELTKDLILQDETLKRAIVRSLEIIGKATKKIAPEFKTRHETITGKKWLAERQAHS